MSCDVVNAVVNGRALQAPTGASSKVPSALVVAEVVLMFVGPIGPTPAPQIFPRVTSSPISPHVYHEVNIHVSFHLLYFLSRQEQTGRRLLGQLAF